MITVTISSPDNGPLELTYAVQLVYQQLVMELGKNNIINERRYIKKELIEDGLCRTIKFDLDIKEIPLGLKKKQGTWKLYFKSPFRKECKKVEWTVRVLLSTKDKDINIPKLDDINKVVYTMRMLTSNKDMRKYCGKKKKKIRF